MLSLNKNNLITKINNKMLLTDGKDKQLSQNNPKISNESNRKDKQNSLQTFLKYQRSLNHQVKNLL
jgi:hypothetical protein